MTTHPNVSAPTSPTTGSGKKLYRDEQNGCGGVKKPLELLALGTPRSAKPHRHGRDGPHSPDGKKPAKYAEHRKLLDVSKALDSDRVVDPVIEGLASQGLGERPEDD
jgi:hypothetical protein